MRDREGAMTEKAVHIFDNGVKVFDRHLTPTQRDRYRKQNVHEADEEALFVQIIDGVPRDGCFVNIGCAVGYYCILAKKLSPGLTIHAVEPLEAHRRYFAENVELNGLDLDDFHVYREAVSGSKGREVFFDRDYGSSILRPEEERASFRSRMRAAVRMIWALFRMRGYGIVKTITLDKLMDLVGKPTDLLQMDVQGLEAEILGGAAHTLRAGVVKTFLLGTHGQQVHQQCIEILKEYEYSIEFEEVAPQSQPDGIIVASKGVRRLQAQDHGI
jgi:FkbM family methyltransferase